MLYSLSWLVSARSPVPRVHRVGWRCGCRIKQWRKGREGSYASSTLWIKIVSLEAIIHISFNKSSPVTEPSKLHLHKTLTWSWLSHKSPFHQPYYSAQGGPEFHQHSNSSSTNGSSPTHKAGYQGFLFPYMITWTGHWLWIFTLGMIWKSTGRFFRSSALHPIYHPTGW